MAEDNGEVRLPKPFEALLEKWPEPERDALFWDDHADRVMDKVEASQWESESHDELLAAPLPAEPDEGSLEVEPTPIPDRAAETVPASARDTAPPRSLLELARASLEDEKKSADSSDIAIQSMGISSRARASAPAIAQQAATESQRTGAVPASMPTPPPPPVSQAAPVASLPAERAKRSAGPLLMVGLGVAGLAAAVAIVVVAQRHASQPLAMAPPPAVSAAAAGAPSPESSARGEEVVQLGDLSEPDKRTRVEAPAAKAGAPVLPKEEKLAAKSGKAGGSSPVAETTAEPAPAEKPKPEKDEEGAKMKPAATAGDIPEKPSVGAVQAAIGSVLGGARACVAGQDAPSQATVTFGSDGRVQSVGVSGPAAGTPAAACIKAALSKARVQPFARPTFTVGTPVRP
jgi:hypothetical protein